ncbi:MAG: type II secretion system ATPase GspE [Verrucomicrobia bacterium]|nr:type II secretion system ATPase GspE [Verrucomicrobiota bacterium]
MTSNDTYVLELLEQQATVTSDQVVKCRESLNGDGRSIVDTLIQSGVIEETEVLATIAQAFGMEYITLEGTDIPADVREMMPSDIARRYRVMPLYKTDEGLTVAMGDPLDFDSLDTLTHMLGCHVQGAVVQRNEIKQALDRYYPADSDMEAMLDTIAEGTVDVAVTGSEDMIQDEAASESDAPIIKLVHLIILEAYRNRASDIHLEPMEKRFRVRYRIDGVLHEVDSPPKRLQFAIVSRVKIMASMQISEKRIPQDGRIQVNIMGRELDLRVSTVPSNLGESVVMRILDKQNLALGLPKLGFFSDDQQTFSRLLSLSDGIVLVTGPTGSGKTTTLYACLGEINRPDRKIITVEDPVEYQLSGINQVQVRPDINFTFSHALRSILRQAPNIIMIGEIRDIETANIATEASLTGHLVFSTLHTNDAPSAITRLLDIGVKPFLVASSIRAVMAQRLVRAICENCKEEYAPSSSELKLLGPAAEQMSSVQLYKGHGCKACSLSGYKGRRGIFEIFVVTDEIQHMIFNKVSALDLRARARELGMRTLREDGLRKTISGMTTLEEVFRVTMGDAD